MTLSFLVERFGYGIRVRLAGSEVALPFTVREFRYGLYYFVEYDDGRTGYLDSRIDGKQEYELYREEPVGVKAGGVAQSGEHSVRNAEVVGSTPITSTQDPEPEIEPEQKAGWFGSIISWIKD